MISLNFTSASVVVPSSTFQGKLMNGLGCVCPDDSLFCIPFIPGSIDVYSVAFDCCPPREV